MGLMGKSKTKSLAKRMVDSVNPVPVTIQPDVKSPKRMPQATVRQTHNGGFIVSVTGQEGYGSEKEHVYETLPDAISCLERHFKAEKSKEDAEGE